MGNILPIILNLLLLRAGPQDFPFDPKLTKVLVPLAILASYIVQVSVSTSSPIIAAATALAVVAGMALGTKLVLQRRNLEARFTQTYHALLVVNSLMTLALWPAMATLAPQLEHLSKNPPVPGSAASIDVSAGALALTLVIGIWNFAANANIFRHAADLTPWRGVAVALLVTLGLQVFVMFFVGMASVVVGKP